MKKFLYSDGTHAEIVEAKDATAAFIKLFDIDPGQVRNASEMNYDYDATPPEVEGLEITGDYLRMDFGGGFVVELETGMKVEEFEFSAERQLAERRIALGGT